MSARENVKAVKDAYAAFSRGDVAGVLASLTEDVEWNLPGMADVPYAGLRKGRAQVAEFFRILAEAEDIQAFEPRHFLAQDDLVVVIGTYAARVKSTGNIAQTDWVHVFEFRDGLAAKWREYYDTAQYAQAYRIAASV